METKQMIDDLRGIAEDLSERGESFRMIDHKKIADRLEELEKQLTERKTSWISVEDEPIPSEYVTRHYFTMLPIIIVKRDPETGNPAYWMRLEPPKPKEPTFKEVFLEKFPKCDPAIFGIYCARHIFHQIKCDNQTFCDSHIGAECWNQPYFEEEGEADA